jgi:preprotein translocase subunit SecA
MGPTFQVSWNKYWSVDYQRPNSAARRKAYNDITYGTNNEFGFDYLRDNMSHFQMIWYNARKIMRS